MTDAPRTDAKGGIVVGLDLLRFCAAFSVMLYHFAFWSWNEAVYETGGRAAIGAAVSFPALIGVSWWGWLGVPVFFAISGYIITKSAQGRTVGDFAIGRALRLLPALWAIALLTFLVTLLYSKISVLDASVLLAKSVVLFPKGPWLDGVYWTLTVEIVFYVLIGLIIWRGSTAWFGWLAGLMAWGSLVFFVAVLACRLAPSLPAAGLLIKLSEAYILKPALVTTSPYFAVGLGLFLLFDRGFSPGRIGLTLAAVVAGAIAVWNTALSSPAVTGLGQPAWLPAVIWVVSMLGLFVAISLHARAKVRRPGMEYAARVLGLATYPLYLVHNVCGGWLFGNIVRAGVEATIAMVLAMLICTAFSIVFAMMIEPPIRDAIKGAISRFLKPAGGVAASA